ncbi:MAG: aminodeoxychorismate/anthranilate synthase component II [Flammeovirgaceae bacterium]|nr:aminodeoxychorismate/anthranilate synthase component II [Flammeovirgaceae bacterium]
MRVLVLDNYDSFTYNIVHILREIDDLDIQVVKNDKIKIIEVDSFDKIILSPGPSLPIDSGKMNELILKYYNSKSILGICLGHQAIAENFGGKLYNMKEPLHGVQTDIYLDNDYIFEGIESEIKACRYHSWSVDKNSFPDELKIIARDSDGVIMALSHKIYDLKGIQFHPESIQTKTGFNMIQNFINN